MDAGTNALDTLTGRAYPLKLGFIGLVNRSQQDILTNKPMSDAIQSEKDFFLNHPSYRSIAHRCGTAYLSKQLNTVSKGTGLYQNQVSLPNLLIRPQILMNHIREKLPDIRSKLSSMIGQTQHELAQYGDMGLTGKMHRVSNRYVVVNSRVTLCDQRHLPLLWNRVRWFYNCWPSLRTTLWHPLTVLCRIFRLRSCKWYVLTGFTVAIAGF